MRRLIAIILACAMLAGCAPQVSEDIGNTVPTIQNTQPQQEIQYTFPEEDMPEFTGLDDTALLAYMEDAVYTELVTTLDNEMYFVENVSVLYISKEYLEEVAYNSQENIFFGYTLSELDACFQGTRYIFTLGEDGQTTVTEFQEYDDTYDQILKNVVVGAGIILICVTVSAISGGAGAPAVSMIFAASAKNGTVMALSSGLFSGVSAGVVTGIETGDFDEAMKAAALAGSEGFKWGAISGVVVGGASEAIALKGATLNGLTMNEAAMIQKQSGYPLDVIKQFQTMEQYQICQSAGLTPQMVNGNMALIRNIDLNYTDEFGMTNLQRMHAGLAPLDPTGLPYELHHVGQRTDSTLAILTRAEHRQGGNHQIWHYIDDATDNPSSQAGWTKVRENFWIKMAELLGGMS